MNDREIRARFGPQHQALLFGWIAREVVTRVGEEHGAVILRQAVWRYGAQRGRRMRLRADRNGHTPDFVAFLAYKEWSAPPGLTEVEVVAVSPDLRQRVTRCPWHAAWDAQGLMPFGRHYCLTVDEAIVYGFNPELRLEVGGTLSNEAECCDFVYHGLDLGPDGATRLEALRRELGDSALMPWDYHAGHLYATVGGAVIEWLDEEGGAALAAALAAFADSFGADMAAVIKGYAEADFAALPQ